MPFIALYFANGLSEIQQQILMLNGQGSASADM
jgi:hypothetical protein